MLYAACELPARSTMYVPINPVKNITSVARNSHIATLPGVTGAWWRGAGAWPPGEAGALALELCVWEAIVERTPGSRTKTKNAVQ